MMIEQAIASVYATMLTDPHKIKTCTKYLGLTLVVRLTRRHKFSKRNSRNEYVLTIGKPNYLERAFIKSCKKAGEPFPVKKVQIKFNPVKRKKK